MRLTLMQKWILGEIKSLGSNLRLSQDARKCALRIEKKGIIKRTDETGNHFELVQEIKDEGQTYLLFVYGTLMRGFGNHVRIQDSKFVSDAIIKGFKMYSMGPFPCVKDGAPHNFVKGEVFEITEHQLRSCDQLEGYPTFYNRKEVQTESGQKVIVYYMNKEKHPDLISVQSGDWRIHIRDDNSYSLKYQH